MPEYVQMSDVSARVPSPFLTQALDDNSDGVADNGVWCAIQKSVATAIDGILGTRFTTPFQNPLPAVVQNSAILFACEALYLRRGLKDNPYTAQADAQRSLLAQIAKGTAPLAPTIQRAQPSASAQTAPADTKSKAPRLS